MVEAVAIKIHPTHMAHRLLALGDGHAHRVARIAKHLHGVVLHAPRFKQRRKIRSLVVAHRIGEVVGLLAFSKGVDKHQQLAAAQDKLVDGVQGRLRQLLRVYQQQHADVVGDLIQAGLEALDLKQLTHFFQHHPRLGGLALHHVVAAINRQTGKQAHCRLLRLSQALNQLAELVLEKLFLIEREERNGLHIIQRVGAGQAKVQGIASGIQRYALQAKAGGFVFGFREGLWVDHVELDLAVGGTLVSTQQFFHAAGVVTQRH